MIDDARSIRNPRVMYNGITREDIPPRLNQSLYTERRRSFVRPSVVSIADDHASVKAPSTFSTPLPSSTFVRHKHSHLHLLSGLREPRSFLRFFTRSRSFSFHFFLSLPCLSLRGFDMPKKMHECACVSKLYTGASYASKEVRTMRSLTSETNERADERTNDESRD